jgi:hypothetical protein
MHPGMRYHCVPRCRIIDIRSLMHNLICHALLHASFIPVADLGFSGGGDGLSFLIIPSPSSLPFPLFLPCPSLSHSFHTPSPHPSPPFLSLPTLPSSPSFPLPFKGGSGGVTPGKIFELEDARRCALAHFRHKNQRCDATVSSTL